MSSAASASSSITLGHAKVFILDKYFNELQKFWETEKRLQEATSSGEAARLQSHLRSHSSNLIDLRYSLQQQENNSQQQQQQQQQQQREQHLNSQLGNYCNVDSTGASILSSRENNFQQQQQQQPQQQQQQQNSSGNSQNGQFPMDGFSTLRSVRSHVTEVSSVANVSDPPSSNGQQQQQQQQPQLSPPRPVSTLQHDYSNIQQPAPIVPQQQPSLVQPPQGPNSLPQQQQQQQQLSQPPSTASGPSPVDSSSANGGAFSRSAVRPRTPTKMKSVDESARRSSSKLAEIQDLIHLDAPPNALEDTILRALQARFFNQKYFTNIGPIVLSVNPYRDVGNPLTLSSTRDCGPKSPELTKVVREVLRLQSESGHPQAVIVSGASGSGKTHTSMVLLRGLFEEAGGAAETDTFKHLAASFAVLRSLGTAKTTANRESSRIGHFIEVQVSEGVLYRTRIHCYFLDQSRVVQPAPAERNYHIFYQMLSGLTPEERRQLCLKGGPECFDFLKRGDCRSIDETADAQRFAEWKANLSVLGIPFMDVVRVLAAILLLGNVSFESKTWEESFDVEVVGDDELNAVAGLLGVPSTLLCQGLISRTHSVRGQPVKAMSDANLCIATRNSLAKSLYCRTVATIVRRANSLKRPVGPLSGTMSSDSNESVHHEVASHHASTVGTAGSKRSAKSMALLNNAVRHATDGFIGILDMFGFEDGKPSRLEQLCINLCAETMQHFYNTHIFKSSVESCREEGIALDVNVEYVDNVPVIDLISSLRTGLLSMLDVECSMRGSPESYVQKVKVQHIKDSNSSGNNNKLFEPMHCDVARTFGIQHYAGQVVYDTTDFLDTNRDVIPDDLVSVFHRDTCSFGFATHLFGHEIKTLLQTKTSQDLARGVSFRIHPTSHPELIDRDEPVTTLTQDFHTRLDNLLRTLVHAKPHFVRCLRPNANESLAEFDRLLVTSQVRSLQIAETVNLMSGGFPHKMRFKAFSARYRLLAASEGRRLFRTDEKAVDDCETILDCYSVKLREIEERGDSNLPRNTAWAHGRKYIFLSEGARQLLERMREEKRNKSANVIQRSWKRWRLRRGAINNNQPKLQRGILNQRSSNQFLRSSQQRPRPQPISGTPPPALLGDGQMVVQSQNQLDRCDFKTIQQTCALFGLDLERPPPIPPSRPYSVFGNKKVAFPQTRVMRRPFPPELRQQPNQSETTLLKGETVMVIGVSANRGHLVVEKRNHTFHVPFHFMEMKQVNGLQ